MKKDERKIKIENKINEILSNSPCCLISSKDGLQKQLLFSRDKLLFSTKSQIECSIIMGIVLSKRSKIIINDEPFPIKDDFEYELGWHDVEKSYCNDTFISKINIQQRYLNWSEGEIEITDLSQIQNIDISKAKDIENKAKIFIRKKEYQKLIDYYNNYLPINL